MVLEICCNFKGNIVVCLLIFVTNTVIITHFLFRCVSFFSWSRPFVCIYFNIAIAIVV